MLWIAFLLYLPAFAALALAMDRHHQACFGTEPDRRRRRLLRATAAVLGVVSVVLAGLSDRPAQSVVELVVAAAMAAMAVVAALTWWPMPLRVPRFGRRR